MAQLDPMARLGRLERDVGEIKVAIVQITDALLDLTTRVDHLVEGQRSLVEGQRSLVEGQRSLVEGQQSVLGRLDRLIEVTIEERTHHYSRMRDFERRLERLEERAGIT